MKLKKLSFRNFKSYSNILTEISFDNKSSINLIIGENGTGKTSIAECITYLLYGKLDNFTASDIPNRINRAFYGKIEVDCDGHLVIIERGLNPSLFKVTVDGNEVDTAGKSNVQSMLEDTYFHIPYSVFNNILVLEIGEVKSLLALNATDKRNIIDKICGFTVYNAYSKVVKEDAKILDNTISTNTGSIRALNINLDRYTQQIEEMRENSATQEEINELIQKVNEAERLKQENDLKIIKLRDAVEEFKTTNNKKATEYVAYKERLKGINAKINLIEGGKCPTCGTSFETEDFQKEKERLLGEKAELEDLMDKIVKVTKTAQAKIDAVARKEREIQAESNSLRIVDLKSDLKYKQTLKESNASPIENLKVGIMKDLENMNEERRKLDEDKKLMDFLVAMFADGGIKRYVSNKYIPIINNLISSMMDYMGLNYTIVFDANFDTKIMQNGVNVKYCTLSRGEKRRVDFAAVIAFIKFLKLQFGELNLLFLDEIFSNVDVNGVNDMIEILNDLSKDMNLNIYLIHHARLEGVMFDNVMRTSKVDGFSKLEYLQ